MDYENMRIAELVKLCAERGIEAASKWRKADYIEALRANDGEAVEAVIVDPESVDMAARMDAGAYLEARSSWVEEMLAPYEGMDAEAARLMDQKEAKSCRADLNRIIAEVEAERKAVKKAYNEPLARFEQAVKDMLAPVREAEQVLKERIDAEDEVKRAFRRQGLEQTYEDFAPLLVPVVPFERILQINPKWMNLSYNSAKAAQELEDAVEKIAKDWEALKRARAYMRHYDEAEAVFFRTLDLSAAMAYNDQRDEEQARIDALKAEQAEARGEEEQGRRRYRFEADLSASELDSLREWKNALHIGGNWTFREVSNG